MPKCKQLSTVAEKNRMRFKQEEESIRGPCGPGPRTFARVVERAMAKLEARLTGEGDHAAATAVARTVEKTWREMYGRPLPSAADVTEKRMKAHEKKLARPAEVHLLRESLRNQRPDVQDAGFLAGSFGAPPPSLTLRGFGAPPTMGPPASFRKPNDVLGLKLVTSGGTEGGSSGKKKGRLTLKRKRQRPTDDTKEKPAAQKPSRRNRGSNGGVADGDGDGRAHEAITPPPAPPGGEEGGVVSLVGGEAPGKRRRQGGGDSNDDAERIAETAAAFSGEQEGGGGGGGGHLESRDRGGEGYAERGGDGGESVAVTSPSGAASTEEEERGGGGREGGEGGFPEGSGGGSGSTGGGGRGGGGSGDDGDSKSPDVIVTANFLGKLKKQHCWNVTLEGGTIEGNGSVIVFDECQCVLDPPGVLAGKPRKKKKRYS